MRLTLVVLHWLILVLHVGVLSDRFAIFSNGHINVVLSPQQLVSCDTANNGCQGGIPMNAWKYLVNTG